ncbi:DUF4186 domain-containing protein [Acerihabitans sp. TG2]|uniref:DUF4186 domain-containing protein n=1 Tax=Acerihabitans sp. TG2 TaxID=3096008 RepID=UPI002B234FEA|nr:DUF4186 domain-containing protein [Acerihabitans sp. TG2]MEA9389186.1 DUF4186 domain-containing protein [Acerihabitans sp. TG2]
MQQDQDIELIWGRLQRSAFRSAIQLNAKDQTYLYKKGLETVQSHARDFIASRLAPAFPAKDGKQTPWRGHPAFVAQHATATCCRGCLEKWHGIIKGRPLNDTEQDYVVQIIMYWLKRQCDENISLGDNL